jgi:hypothetical protein
MISFKGGDRSTKQKAIIILGAVKETKGVVQSIITWAANRKDMK